MSDKMRPIEYKELLKYVIKEYKENGTCFQVPFYNRKEKLVPLTLHNKIVENPLGPAAGPHTQLAHNILCAYAAGARYFELKTIQILEGESLGIQKPCIYVKDEAYNIEWSTELTVEEAFEEYAKAWFLLKLIIKEFNLGDENGFIFNMSVGYNLEGIKSKKVDLFIESMKDAKDTKIWEDIKSCTLSFLSLFEHVTKDYIESISSNICDIITLSTMHGCPAEEIEDIANYLIKEKQLNVYIKCNPTLLGYEKVRTILDAMGYQYIKFGKEDFEHDLSIEAAVTLIQRLKITASNEGKEFGIKLTNTFPVKITKQELEGENMYMSGASLYPLSIGVAALLAEAFHGDIKISYSGGVDENNINAILETGIKPITVSTILLKQGGYKNLTKLWDKINCQESIPQEGIAVDRLEKFAKEVVLDKRYYKPIRKESPKKDIAYSSFCSTCKNCVDVCPNRANVTLIKNEKKYTVHMDSLCNECGNCSCFCPLGHIPYKEKMTLFQETEDFYSSHNEGFLIRGNTLLARIRGKVISNKTEFDNLRVLAKLEQWTDLQELVEVNEFYNLLVEKGLLSK